MIVRFVPEVGWHRGVPSETYHEVWDAVNASRLSHLAVTPAHCKWYEDNPEELTPSRVKTYRTGRAFHCAVLEPHELEARFCVDPQSPDGGYPQGWRNTKAYKAAVLELVGIGFEPLPADDWEFVRRARESVWSTPSHGLDLLDAADDKEVSVVADDPATGLRCKVRPDIVVRAGGVIGELKGVESADEDAFSKALYNFGWWRAAPFYVDACNWSLGGKPFEHHVFLAVEKAPPYAFRTFTLSNVSVREEWASSWELGRRSYRRLLDQYASCLGSGEWPGYPSTTQPIDLPGWASMREGIR